MRRPFTLDRCSNGRFILGLGAGYHKTEFFALGVDFDERNALFDEALELLPKAWSGEPFDASLPSRVRSDHLGRLGPIDDVRASAAYRMDASLTLVRRTLEGLVL